ncbi:MAG: GFA family protein [Pseudomonadota bacterium]|nr:GFA family protein [Pseudomonadota bacterium]MED5408971.1 GFA family protein [Pseudomonadota bacterium]
MKISGSCHCQAVKYSVESDGWYPYQKCYCTICRKTSGGEGYAINLSADASSLQVEGEQHLQIYQAILLRNGRQKKSEHRRMFCRNCGSHLWASHSAWPELLHPLASSVDSELPTAPCYTHIMLGSKASWVRTFATGQDLCFDDYPEESIAEWHDRITGI